MSASLLGESSDAVPRRSRAEILPEIQALRAVAVLLVVVYHLWPRYVPGGYIGVDVFFVISGFLITSHIVRQVVDTATFTLGDFYVRRIRRLLPAALIVLVVVGVVTLRWAPQTLWNDTGKQIVASAFYVENWALVANSVDYLGAAIESSPVQHFWSLSVEEQFYLIWPILIVLTWAAMRRARRATRDRLGIVLLVVGALSLTVSVLGTIADQPSAYFSTLTRVWEFAVGGALAVYGKRLRLLSRPAIALSWSGLMAIAAAALTFSSSSAFPGLIALIPVLGTAAVIAGGHPSGLLSLTPAMNLRPVQFLGDISYSVYLWHWPLIVFTPLILERALDLPVRVALLIGSFGVGWFSKRYFEDPFRSWPRSRTHSRAVPRSGRSRPAVVYLLAASGMIVTAAIGGSAWASSESRIAEAQKSLNELSDPLSIRCFGAASLGLGTGCAAASATPASVIYPDPMIARHNTAADGCQQSTSSTELLVCSFGPDGPGALRVALAGDSHAGQWLGALRGTAERNGWHLETYLRSGCALAEIPLARNASDSCAEWNKRALHAIVDKPYDLVIVSARSSVVGGGAKPKSVQDADASNMARAWKEIIGSGSQLVAIRDIPQPGNGGVFDVPTCVLENAGFMDACSVREAAAVVPDPQEAAAEATSGTRLIDMAQYFCSRQACPAVIGGVLVYGDGNHMTALYGETLTPYLDSALRLALAQ